MTLDEYIAGTDQAWIGYSGDHRALLDEAISRIADLTADRDKWKFRAETATEGMRNVEARRWGVAGRKGAL